MDKRGRHFVLVHGSCHGAWCWYKVATLLRSAGHRVTALDMAACGINPKRANEIRSVADYFEPLMEFMAALPPEERVILVAHSMGGLPISVAMERFPEKIGFAFFVTAVMPGPDLSFSAITQKFHEELDSYMDSQFTFENGSDKPPTSILFGPKFLSTKLYQLSPPEDLTLATSLARPFPLFDKEELSKKIVLATENYGSVHRAYIVSDKDIVMKQNLQEWMIENNPTDEVTVISGSDHMVMVSKPQELCTSLLAIVEKCY